MVFSCIVTCLTGLFFNLVSRLAPKCHMCSFCLNRMLSLGLLPGLLATVKLLAWSKVFHPLRFLLYFLFFYFFFDFTRISYLMDSDHCHVDNQSGSLFTCLLGQFKDSPRDVDETWFGLVVKIGPVSVANFLFCFGVFFRGRFGCLYILAGYPGSSLYLWIVLNSGIVSKELDWGVLLAKVDNKFGSQVLDNEDNLGHFHVLCASCLWS